MKLGIIGFAGSGKSSLLKIAESDGYKTLDTDVVLEKKINIDLFISDNDDIEYRKLEKSAIIEALDSTADVIAFGGGVHSGHIAWQNIHKSDIEIVFLKQCFEKCIERASDRPLFKKVGLNTYREIFEERQEKYSRASGNVVSVENKTPKEVWREVKAIWI